MSSMEFNVHEAKTHFSRLLDLALQGEEVVILRNGVAVVELVPARKRILPLGAGRNDTQGENDSWWHAMNDSEVADFFGGK